MRAQPAGLPTGFLYRPGFVPPDEEAALLPSIESLPFHQVRMKVVSRRTVVHFGWDDQPAPPIPIFLLHVREMCAFAAGLPPEELAQVLVSRYPEGAGIGWHREAPMFGPVVAGISLGAACRMRFRRPLTEGYETSAVLLEARSMYLLRGEALSDWQQSIPALKSVRYSVTFRQVRRTWLERHGHAPPSP